MDNKTNIPIPYSLDKQLSSYSLLIIFLILFIILSVFLYIREPSSFNKILGKEIFITGTLLLILAFLIKDIIAFRQRPESSFLASLEFSKQPLFLPFTIVFMIIIAIGSIYSMLYVAGVFNRPAPENNISIIINFLLLALFITVSISVYLNSKEKDNNILSKYPKVIQEMFNSRTNYTILFFLFILFAIIFYFVNPYGLVSDYGSPLIFFIIFIGLVMVGMILIYQNALANPNKISNLPNFLQIVLKGFYVIISLFISGLLIYYLLNFMGVFNQDASNPDTWGKFIFNITF